MIPPDRTAESKTEPHNSDKAQASAASAGTQSAARHPRNYVWAELMRRVWEFDVLVCECGGRLRIASAIHPPETTRKILDASICDIPCRAARRDSAAGTPLIPTIVL